MKERKWIKITAFITLFAFIFSFVLSEPIFAASGIIQEKRSSGEFKAKLGNFVLPYKYGRVTDSALRSTNKLVVWIQDLHCHAQVQKNIYEIISIFDSKYGVSKIYLEGAPAGKLDTSILNTIPNEEIKTKTIENLMEKGLLSGVEYFALKKDNDKVYGLEDWNVYKNNLNRVRELADEKEVNVG
ncbi:hypothetical protein ACFL58_04605, partial [Elusimicrobiota bacterium]